jgi:hypothetical protein
MQPSPAGSFLRFVLGLFVFVGVSIGVTILASTYGTAQDAHIEAAAAEAAMLQSK